MRQRGAGGACGQKKSRSGKIGLAAKFRAGVGLRAGREVGKARLGALPGDGFLDALLEGDFGRAEDGIGFVHGRYVVGDHAAVAGGRDVEGLAG